MAPEHRRTPAPSSTSSPAPMLDASAPPDQSSSSVAERALRSRRSATTRHRRRSGRHRRPHPARRRRRSRRCPFNHFALPRELRRPGGAHRRLRADRAASDNRAPPPARATKRRPCCSPSTPTRRSRSTTRAHSNCEGDSGGPALFDARRQGAASPASRSVVYVGCPVDDGVDRHAHRRLRRLRRPVRRDVRSARVAPGGACTSDADCGALPCITGVCAQPCDPKAASSTCLAGTVCTDVDGKTMCGSRRTTAAPSAVARRRAARRRFWSRSSRLVERGVGDGLRREILVRRSSARTASRRRGLRVTVPPSVLAAVSGVVVQAQSAE